MLLPILLVFLAPLALSAQTQRSVDVFAWPLSASKPTTLAHITYNSTSASVQNYIAPHFAADEEVVRIGFYHPSGSWSGVASAASNLAANTHKTVQLYLNTDHDLYHVGFKVSPVASSSKSGNSKDGLNVEVVRLRPGQMPPLSKPVQLNAQGKVEEKPVEKSFVQK